MAVVIYLSCTFSTVVSSTVVDTGIDVVKELIRTFCTVEGFTTEMCTVVDDLP